MSYCRWSDNDHQCDVYAYEHCAGHFAIHVAAMRLVFNEPLPPPEEFRAGNIHAWHARHMKMNTIIGNAARVSIGLPNDGDNIHVSTAGECADELERLRAIGYRVPQYAIDALRDEQDDEEE